MSEVKIPECPYYVAHPQAVWFNEHWRPLLAAKDAEIKKWEVLSFAYLEQRHQATVDLNRLRVEIKDLRSELAEKDKVIEFYSEESNMAESVLAKYSKGEKND